MASDRPTYDQGAYLTKTKESAKPLSYIMQINAHENCEPCGDKPNVTNHSDRVDLENDLFGLTRKLSKDPNQKYQKDANIAKILNYNPPYLCERSINDPSFINNTNPPSQYMEDLKKSSPEKLMAENNISMMGAGYNKPNVMNNAKPSVVPAASKMTFDFKAV